MPREGRRVREARKARQRRRTVQRDTALLLAVAIVVIGGAALLGLHNRRPQAGRARPIDGIPCATEQGNDHEHSHLRILEGGRALPIPVTIGYGASGCLYWLHTHDSDPAGLIHIEAPHRILPTLGAFFDMWRQPLSRREVAGIVARDGQAIKVYVGQTHYLGNPRRIHLRPHTAITIEIGPPFRQPQRYRFGQGY